MSLINFTVEFDLFACGPDSTDEGLDSDLIPLIGDVTFTPQFNDNRPALAPGYSPRPAGFRILAHTGYMDSTGRLMDSRGGNVGVRLPAADPVLNLGTLWYRVDFNLTTPLGEPVAVTGGYFEALSTDGTVNLANVLQSTSGASGGGTVPDQIYASEIVDSTTVGRALIKAANETAARTALGGTATGGAVFTAANAAAARKAINADTYINAKDFGAVGDGTTDDTTALQNWLDAVVEAQGRGYLPNGDYKITSTLVIPGPSFGWTISGENVNYSRIMQHGTNIPVLQVGTEGELSHTHTIENLLLGYASAQPSTNTNASCIVFEGVHASSGPYWCTYRNLYFYRGHYAMKVPTGAGVPWACHFDMLTMTGMSGGMMDCTGAWTGGGVNNTWGRATMHCNDCIGPIFKNWNMMSSTVQALEFLEAYQGPQLITTSTPFSCDFRSIRLENGTYNPTGSINLINMPGSHFVSIGQLEVGGAYMNLAPTGSGKVYLLYGDDVSKSDSYIRVDNMFLGATAIGGNGEVYAVNGGSLPNHRKSIGQVQLENGWLFQYTGGTITGDFVKVDSWVNGALSANLGDANYTVTVGHPNVAYFGTAFTAQRTITLPAASSTKLCAGLYYDLVFDGAINGANSAVIKHGSTTLRTQTTDGVRLRYQWRRGDTGGQWVLTGVIPIASSNSDPVTVAESLRANRNISGGGTIAVDGSGYVSWSTRFIVASGGNGTNFSQDGFFNIACPTSGTITGVGGATNKTATSAGIPLDNFEALYYILPIGLYSTSLPENFRVVSYSADIDVPHNWVLICVRNQENGVFNFPNGINLKVGESCNTGAGLFSQRVAVPSTASSTGLVGQWSADASYAYFCTAANTWKRVSIATW